MASLRDFLFYAELGIEIYCGDCREVLQLLPTRADTIVTDPVWPNTGVDFDGIEAWSMFADAARLFPARADRLIVHLGCDSDPRFVASVPPSYRFFRVCWLEYACPTRKGRVLYTGDVAYVFGPPPASRPGRRVLPGRVISGKLDVQRDRVSPHKEWGKANRSGHPAPRRYQHVLWLVSRFADGLVIDPFAGSGTTLQAAKHCNLPAIGIEIEPKYCEIAVKRLRQEVLPLG